MENDLNHSKKLFDKLYKGLSDQIPMLIINGDLVMNFQIINRIREVTITLMHHFRLLKGKVY